MPSARITVGPRDHGKRMPLESFEHAHGAEGYKYELCRGIVAVEAPKAEHAIQIDAVNRQLYAYRGIDRSMIRLISMGSGCKLLLPDYQSERHPDIAIYKTDKPAVPDFWAHWVPEIVIEV